MRLSWHDLGTPRADDADGKTVEFVGWPNTALPVRAADYFLLTGEPGCCAGCLPANPLAVVEVGAEQEIEFGNTALRLSGMWRVQRDDPAGWRYQLHGARRIGLTRRTLLAASPIFCLPATATAQTLDGTAIDMHSHAGNLLRMTWGRGKFSAVADPMRQGGL